MLIRTVECCSVENNAYAFICVKYSEDKDWTIDCLIAVHLELCLFDIQTFGSKNTFLLAVWNWIKSFWSVRSLSKGILFYSCWIIFHHTCKKARNYGYIYIYIYIHTYTHTYIHTYNFAMSAYGSSRLGPLSDGHTFQATRVTLLVILHRLYVYNVMLLQLLR